MAAPADLASDELVCFAVLTPAGRGAIATVAVCGTGAVNAVSRRFTSVSGKPLTSFPVGRVVFGRFRTAADCAEELVVGIVALEEIEIHCHGGRAAVAAICEALAAEDCIEIEPADWQQRQTGDQLAADALLALSHARTERTAAVLLDQYRGALRRELTRIDQMIGGSDYAAAAEAINAFASLFGVGLHLTEPWRVAIAGRPNAGKSSLMNALVGYERAIVFAEPGTTRDVLTASTAIDGWPLDLLDTAGLRQSTGAIEAEGVERAERQIRLADLVLLVADLTQPWDREIHRHVTGLIASREATAPSSRLLIVHNKRDLTTERPADRPAGIRISARTGDGIHRLCHAIIQTLVPVQPESKSAVPFHPRHVRALTAAAAHLATGDAKLARGRIRSLLI